MTRLPRLWDEKIESAKGREVRRFGVNKTRTFYHDMFYVHDKVTGRYYAGCEFRTRKTAENWLKKTTVRSYQLQCINETMHMSD